MGKRRRRFTYLWEFINHGFCRKRKEEEDTRQTPLSPTSVAQAEKKRKWAEEKRRRNYFLPVEMKIGEYRSSMGYFPSSEEVKFSPCLLSFGHE